MAIYVDEIVEHDRVSPAAARYGKKWCHLTTDGTVDDLHAFAALLGLRRSWFQDRGVPHYDIVPSVRARALALGAVFKLAREQSRERLARRKAAQSGEI